MTRDPLHPAQDGKPLLAADASQALRRVSLIRVATGALALALIAAIWIVWRFG